MTTLLIERRDGQDAAPGAQPEPEPVPRTFTPDLDGAAVLDEARDFLARFWVPPSVAALDVMVLWAAHAAAADTSNEMVWYSTPRLAFVSDEPGSGKTAALELLGLLCPRPQQVTDPTAPALLNLIAERRATLLIDEVDLLFGGGMAAKAVRAVINSGYRKGATVARVKGPQDTFAPVAMAGLASSFMANPTLRPTRDRCIIIRCSRPPQGVKVPRFREQLHAPLGMLAGASVAAWAASAVMDLATRFPEMPPELTGRSLDVWEPLFAVAAVAGGHWPASVLAACRELVLGDSDAEPALPPRARLLADIRAVWPEGTDRMPAAALVGALGELPGAPWAGMWSPVAMLAEIPAMLGISPARIESGGHEVQGYWRSQIAPLWDDSTEEER